MLATIKAIIFDHDGTLVDSEPVHFACWNQVLARYNRRFEFVDYCTHLNGTASLDSARWIIAHCQLELSADDLYRQKQSQLEAYLQVNAFPLMLGARELLEYAAQTGYSLALASGAGRYEINHSLTSHDLTQLLPVTATKNDVRHNKPAPDVYLFAAQQLSVAPANTLAIEDSDTGEASALAAGMWCFRLGTSARPHARVKNFSSLEAIRQHLMAFHGSR